MTLIEFSAIDIAFSSIAVSLLVFTLVVVVIYTKRTRSTVREHGNDINTLYERSELLLKFSKEVEEKSSRNENEIGVLKQILAPLLHEKIAEIKAESTVQEKEMEEAVLR